MSDAQFNSSTSTDESQGVPSYEATWADTNRKGARAAAALNSIRRLTDPDKKWKFVTAVEKSGSDLSASCWHPDEVEEVYKSNAGESRKMIGLEVGPLVAYASRLASSLDLRDPDIKGLVDAWIKVATTYDSAWDKWTKEEKTRWSETEADVQGLEEVSKCVERMLR